MGLSSAVANSKTTAVQATLPSDLIVQEMLEDIGFSRVPARTRHIILTTRAIYFAGRNNENSRDSTEKEVTTK